VALRESEVADLIIEGLSFLTFAEESVMRFNSSARMLNLTAFTREFIRPQR